MFRAYDDNGNVVDLVKWEEEIRADERTRCVDECIEIVRDGCYSDVEMLIGFLERMENH